MKYTCKGAKVYQEEELVGRKECGANLTEQVLAVAQDGKEYEVRCKACGNFGLVRRTPPDPE